MSGEDKRASVGDVIDGRYRLLSMLGQGGMGKVYRAEHIGIKREVAIKLLHSELRDHEGIVERVMREAFATGRLDHPNCVSITDSGVLEGGGTYLVMELLKGESLGDKLDRLETLSLREALSIARDLLGGLSHAHGVGVVHRDLKPDNVFLVETPTDCSDEFPVAKILDFGIAKLLGEAKTEAGGGDLTAAGMAIGSPTYMSPEQATGGAIDGRTDLYTLSLIFHEMLTGEPPFYEPDDKVRALQRRLKEKPPVLVSSTGEKIPKSLQKLLQDGLAKNDTDRIPDAATYLRRLEPIIDELSSVSVDKGSIAIPTPTPLPSLLPEHTEEVPASSQGRFAQLSPEVLRNLKVAAGVVLGVVVLIALVLVLGGDEKNSDSEEILVMEPDHLQDSITIDPAVLAERLAKELDGYESEIVAGRGAAHIDALRKLQSVWPRDARANYLLGLAYMDKRFWVDGFKYLRSAIELDERVREEPLLIKAAIRSLTSQSKPGVGQRFLVKQVGAPAIPYLEETAKGGTKRQRKYAERALKQLESVDM